MRKVTLLSFFIITIAISLVFTSQIAFSEHSERTSKSNLPKVEFDKKTYLLDDTLEITITDNVENHNPNKQESIYFKIYSELFRSGVLVEAEETNENSGIFTMDFRIIQLSSSHGDIKASYSYSIRDKSKTLNATSQIVEPISETEEKKPEIKTPPEPKITPPEKHPEPIIFSKSAFGSLRVESGEYVLSEKVGSTTISISGKLTYEKIVPVYLIMMKPDETIETVEVRVLDDGSFVYQILLEPNSEPGFYQIRAKFEEGQFGPVSYIVVESKVPNWIKSNARWWADGTIGDSDFVNGIQYLIKEKIIVIENIPQATESKKTVPEWVKNNAGWWADGLISEKDFVTGLQYLVKTGIIHVS